VARRVSPRGCIRREQRQHLRRSYRNIEVSPLPSRVIFQFFSPNHFDFASDMLIYGCGRVADQPRLTSLPTRDGGPRTSPATGLALVLI
jgi:hypothetical protein